MEPVKTPESNHTFKAPDGYPEVKDLSVVLENDPEDGTIRNRSTWDLSELEREQIAEGGKVDFCIWGDHMHPVSLAVDAPFCHCGERMAWNPEVRTFTCDHSDHGEDPTP